MKIQEKYMLRCIQLAKKGRETAAPNPIVGSVIVYEKQIVGEGYTSAYGGSHAEVNAIQSVADKSLLSKATLYVSLEPCSHFGKTPPCADLILKHNIPEVVIGVRDPNHLVSGKGIAKLKKAGCKVFEGVLEEDCADLNRKFFVYHQKKRPYVILKWAQSQDGFLAPVSSLREEKPIPFWITNSYSRQLVHQWRTQEQAVLVGTNTALSDNPKLNVREWKGTSPVRVVLDRSLKIPGRFHIMDQKSQTLILTEVTDDSRKLKGIQYHHLDFSSHVAEQVCKILWKQEFLSVIVEGGAEMLNTFINSDLWDEARIFTGPESLLEGISAPELKGNLSHREEIGSDVLEIFCND